MLTATATNATETAHFKEAARGLSPTAARALIVFSMAAGLGLALLASGAGDTARAVSQAGPDLTRLLRAMAAIKSVMAAGAVAALLWRLGGAAGPLRPGSFRLGAYAASSAAMSAGPAVIWQMAHVGTGALLLHGGLLACALLLWRDPATATMLQAAVARRRARA